MFTDIEKIREQLEKNIDNILEDFSIELIYVFGSYAKGTNDTKSDLDIALLLENKVSESIRLDILNEFVDIFKIDNIDLVILNSVNEVLKFQVIKYGKVLYMKDFTTKVMFEARTMSEYMDMEYFRNTQYKYGHMRFMELFGKKRTKER